METYFGADAKRINHAHRVTAYAEQLMVTEGGDKQVVIGAAVLHDIGIHMAERKYGSPAGKFQEIEGPPIARNILTSLKFNPIQIDEICEIIANHHSPGKIKTKNFGILYDADWLVNLKDEYDIQDREKLGNIIDRVFLTESGRSLARKMYLVARNSN
jgi:HD superfamily phosphodiesterase